MIIRRHIRACDKVCFSERARRRSWQWSASAEHLLEFLLGSLQLHLLLLHQTFLLEVWLTSNQSFPDYRQWHQK